LQGKELQFNLSKSCQAVAIVPMPTADLQLKEFLAISMRTFSGITFWNNGVDDRLVVFAKLSGTSISLDSTL